MAHVVAYSLYFTDASGWQAGAEVGLWMWLGFIATDVGIYGFEGRNWKLWPIDKLWMLFGLLALGLYRARNTLSDAWNNLVTVAARTAMFMVNFAFWVGSLWGDRIGEHWFAPQRWSDRSEWREAAIAIPDHVFTLGWIGALVAMIFTSRRNSFLSITSIAFLTIHGYTQYFEYLGAKPETLVIGGLVLVGLAVAGARFFMKQDVEPA